MKVMVLAGGPDRERAVSLKSGAEVARALRAAGHEVRERDLGPGDEAGGSGGGGDLNEGGALEEFVAWVGHEAGGTGAGGTEGGGGSGDSLADTRRFAQSGSASASGSAASGSAGSGGAASGNASSGGAGSGGATSGGGGVVFPVFHGEWGEGGACQALLEARGLAFVGCREAAARRCFDKAATKRALEAAGLPTPEWEVVEASSTPTLEPPVVLKPLREGSSIDLRLCRDAATLAAAWAELAPRHGRLLVERLVEGREMTVGVVVGEELEEGNSGGGAIPDASPRAAQRRLPLGGPTFDERGLQAEVGREGGGGVIALPSIQIVPATEFYDYAAKYERDDTRYVFDAVDGPLEAQLRHLALEVFGVLGCRHLARVDLFVDGDDRPWVIEVNTLPGFTDHSLLPMAARRAGLELPVLVDRLVRAAAGGV